MYYLTHRLRLQRRRASASLQAQNYLMTRESTETAGPTRGRAEIDQLATARIISFAPVFALGRLGYSNVTGQLKRRRLISVKLWRSTNCSFH